MTFWIIAGAVLALWVWWSHLQWRRRMRGIAKRQLEYNDIYSEESAKKEAREEREHGAEH
jgi:hypothetical protein